MWACRCYLLALLAIASAAGHAPVLPPVQGPLQTRANLILDRSGTPPTLRGVSLPGLEQPGVSGFPPFYFGVIRLRWNMNLVRLPVSARRWRAEGAPYMELVAAAVLAAQANALLVAIAPVDDGDLPSANTIAFWRAWATRFQSNPGVIFSLFHEPKSAAPDYRLWRDGGDGGIGMQALVEAIRATGAQQLITAPAFHSPTGFAGLTPDLELRGDNISYEIHPFYAFGLTDADRDAAFGSLAARRPVFAGDWGLARECGSLPADFAAILPILFETLAYFDRKQIAWAAGPFSPSGLITDTTDFQPTALPDTFACGSPGLGEVLAAWLTGDPTGFGALRADAIANAAGGPSTPVAPGQLLSIYIEQLGPNPQQFGLLGADGRLPSNLGGAEVLFDGTPAPVLFASPFQLNVQAPYSLTPGTRTSIRVRFNGVPSNLVSVPVVEAAPELFHDPVSQLAAALNQDGSRNAEANPAPGGSIVVLYGSGGGATFTNAATGVPAPAPHPLLRAATQATVDNQPADVLFAGEVPGFVGLLQLNLRLPQPRGRRRTVPVQVRVGSAASRAPALLWVQ